MTSESNKEISKTEGGFSSHFKNKLIKMSSNEKQDLKITIDRMKDIGLSEVDMLKTI